MTQQDIKLENFEDRLKSIEQRLANIESELAHNNPGTITVEEKELQIAELYSDEINN